MTHTDDTRAQAVALYTEGLTMAEVADRLGVSTMSVQRWVKKAGIKARPRGGRTKEAE